MHSHAEQVQFACTLMHNIYSLYGVSCTAPTVALLPLSKSASKSAAVHLCRSCAFLCLLPSLQHNNTREGVSCVCARLHKWCLSLLLALHTMHPLHATTSTEPVQCARTWTTVAAESLAYNLSYRAIVFDVQRSRLARGILSIDLSLCAEAEAEANKLRQRGSELERLAKKLRSLKSASAAKPGLSGSAAADQSLGPDPSQLQHTAVDAQAALEAAQASSGVQATAASDAAQAQAASQVTEAQTVSAVVQVQLVSIDAPGEAASGTVPVQPEDATVTAASSSTAPLIQGRDVISDAQDTDLPANPSGLVQAEQAAPEAAQTGPGATQSGPGATQTGPGATQVGPTIQCVPGAVQSAPEAVQSGPGAALNVAEPVSVSPRNEQIAPGLVVWGTVKGWPPWPAIVLTAEEMDVAVVLGQRGNLLKGLLTTYRTLSHQSQNMLAWQNLQ